MRPHVYAATLLQLYVSSRLISGLQYQGPPLQKHAFQYLPMNNLQKGYLYLWFALARTVKAHYLRCNWHVLKRVLHVDIVLYGKHDSNSGPWSVTTPKTTYAPDGDIFD